MDIKEINPESNTQSKKIVSSGKSSFKLWLEFEETTTWNDLKNDFANISVDMMDGRKYGINVWTFEFLNTAIKMESENKEINYILPPDLFVKELTRECIEQTIIELLQEGNLEEVLNYSVFGLVFLEPYWDALEMEEKSIKALINEINQELLDDHILSNQEFDLIARKTNNDDIILELEDGRIAVVHLIRKSKREIEGYPITRIYKNKIEFWNKEMKHNIGEYNT